MLSRHDMRQRRPVLICAGAVRNGFRQRAQHAGLSAAALALSGLCLVGSKFYISDLSSKAAWPQSSDLILVRASTGATARLEGVNKPELLPKEFTTVIDVAGFLTEGEVGN